jgi:hypothetical protein
MPPRQRLPLPWWVSSSQPRSKQGCCHHSHSITSCQPRCIGFEFCVSAWAPMPYMAPAFQQCWYEVLPTSTAEGHQLAMHVQPTEGLRCTMLLGPLTRCRAKVQRGNTPPCAADQRAAVQCAASNPHQMLNHRRSNGRRGSACKTWPRVISRHDVQQDPPCN